MENKLFQFAPNLDMDQEEIQIIGTNTICRLCASQNDKLIGIFSEEGITNELPNKINLYLPIKVSPSDELPLQCCWNCASTILAWHELVITSVEIDKKFRSAHFIPEPEKVTIEESGLERTDNNPLSDDNGTCDNDNDGIESKAISTSLNDFSRSPLSQDAKQKTPKKRKKPEAIACFPVQDATHLETYITDIEHQLIDSDLVDASDFKVDIVSDQNNTTDEENRNEGAPKNYEEKEIPYFGCQHCPAIFFVKTSIVDHVKQEHGHDYDVKSPGKDVPKAEIKTDASAKREKRKPTKIDQEAINAAKVVVDGRIYYNCKECNKNLHSPYTFTWHMRIHTGERPYVCDLCGKQFRVSQGLVRHLRETHEGIKKFPCDLCGRMFATRRNVEEHRRIHTNERPYVCDLCGKSFKQKASLFVHKRSHRNHFPFRCSYCNQGFRTKPPLLVHITRHTGEKPYKCDVCGRCFRIKYELKRHRLIHSDEKPWVCNICGFSFRQKRYLRNHTKSNHAVVTLFGAAGNIAALFEAIKRREEQNEEKKKTLLQDDGHNKIEVKEVIIKEEKQDTLETGKQCEICDKILSCRPNYISHVKTHVSDFYCRICSNSYNTKFKLDTHFNSHNVQDVSSGDPNYVHCSHPNCIEFFPSKLQLYRHRNTHSTIPSYKCDQCTMEFIKLSAFEKHKLKHENPLSCDICDKTFANKKTLREHERLHTGEKPFKCQLCHMKFRCQSGLKYHEVSHSKERKYKCQLCPLTFTRSNYLKEHLRKHSKERPYECKICKMKFIQMGVLSRHEKRVHAKCDICETIVGRAKNLHEHKRQCHIIVLSKEDSKDLIYEEPSARQENSTDPKSGFCTICRKTLSRARDLKRHLSACHSEQEKGDGTANVAAEICSVCHRTFDGHDDFKKHMREIHKMKEKRRRRKRHEISPQFFCDFCDKGFTRKYDMEKHRGRAHAGQVAQLREKKVRDENLEILEKCKDRGGDGKVFYKCDFCQRRFAQRYNLMRHRTVHTGVREFFCHICGKSFRMSNGLTRHIEAFHHGKKNFSCENCKKMFTTRAARDEHMNIHTNNRPFICDSCGKSFKQKASLHVHKMFHSDTFRFECNNCGKKFRRNQDLKVHSWMHTGHRPYACGKCKAAFRLRHDLTRHLRIHEKSNECICNVCGSVFSQERYLKVHKRIHGKMERKEINPLKM